MDGRARFALAQAQKDARKNAKAKVGLAEDLYVDLQRQHRKLNRVRIRASEVHVKTSRRLNTDASRDELSSIRGEGSPRATSPRTLPAATRGRHGGNFDCFSLPSYIVEMNRELLEDDIDPPDADRNPTPGANSVALADLGPGLGDAAAAFSGNSAAVAGPGIPEQSLVVGGNALADPSAAPGANNANAIGSRTGAGHRDRVLPTLNRGGDVPRMPTFEMMPQHLPSDTYWVHRPVYISTQQVRWEKRDGAQAIISMRSELMPKVCLDGVPRRMVHTANASPDSPKGRMQSESCFENSKRSIGPAEAKIWGAEGSHR